MFTVLTRPRILVIVTPFKHYLTPCPLVTMQDSAALPEFMVSILSYAQLIFLKGNTPKASYLLLQNVLKPLLGSIAEYNQKDKTKLGNTSSPNLVFEIGNRM